MPRHRFARLYAIETNPHAVADLICHNATRARSRSTPVIGHIEDRGCRIVAPGRSCIRRTLGLNCAASDERTALARTGPLAKFTVRPWRERYEQAARIAERGRDLVALQRALIDRQKALGQDASWLERGLDLFEKSQTLFERDLERIRHERH
jgi:hypothetical protein